MPGAVQVHVTASAGLAIEYPHGQLALAERAWGAALKVLGAEHRLPFPTPVPKPEHASTAPGQPGALDGTPGWAGTAPGDAPEGESLPRPSSPSAPPPKTPHTPLHPPPISARARSPAFGPPGSKADWGGEDGDDAMEVDGAGAGRRKRARVKAES